MVISSPPHQDSGRDETVTLTKTQLRAILQTLNGSTPEEGIQSLEASRQRHQSLPSLKAELEEECGTPIGCQDSATFVSQLSRTAPLPPIPSSSGDAQVSARSSRGETPVHLPSSPSLQDLCKPASHGLSKVERKRLQWEKEKAEMQEWNPWGKPGAGAPLRNNFYATNRQAPGSAYSSATYSYNDFLLPLDCCSFSNGTIDVAGEEEGLSVNGQTRSIQYRSPIHVARREENGNKGRGSDEQTERRQRALQYKREIELQVEEKRRRQREERERQIREEQEEEAKLALERQRLQSEYNMEQERLRIKEDQKQKKQELLISAVKKAQASAEAARRVSKQKKISPDVTQSSPSPPSVPSTAVTLMEEFTSVVTLPPSPPTPPLGRRECAVQAALADTCRCSHNYVENRVLTPSKLRIQTRLCHSRDFATQTERAILESLSPFARDQSASSEESSSEGRAPERASGVQPFRPPRMAKPQPAPSTTPNQKGFRRKKLQELRKQHWEREMANQRLVLSADHHSDADNSIEAEFPHSPPSPLRGHPRTSSPPVPALQRKLGLAPRDDRPLSPPVPALRRKLEAALPSTTSAPSVFPQPSPQLRHQWSHSSEHLHSAQLEHRFSLPTSGGSTLGFSSSTSSSSSASSSNPTMRRRWRSQETFLIPDNFPGEPNVAVVAPTQASPQCRSASVGTRRRWDTESYFSAPEDEATKNSKPPTPDPLVHPEMVTGRPTARQDRILQQLTDLRQGLMKKQKELESMLVPHS